MTNMLIVEKTSNSTGYIQVIIAFVGLAKPWL